MAAILTRPQCVKKHDGTTFHALHCPGVLSPQDVNACNNAKPIPFPFYCLVCLM